MKAIFFLQIGAELLGNLCKVCGKVFNGRNWKQNLEYHFLTHTKEKPFKCPICPHRSALKYNLIRHIRNRHRNVLNPGLQGKPGSRENSEDVQAMSVHGSRATVSYWDVDLVRSQRNEVPSREVQLPQNSGSQNRPASQTAPNSLGHDVQVSLSQEGAASLTQQTVVSRDQEIYLGSGQEGHLGMTSSVREMRTPVSQGMNVIPARENNSSCGQDVDLTSNQDMNLHVTQEVAMNPSHEISIALNRHNQSLVGQEIDMLPNQESQMSVDQGNMQHLEH